MLMGVQKFSEISTYVIFDNHVCDVRQRLTKSSIVKNHIRCMVNIVQKSRTYNTQNFKQFLKRALSLNKYEISGNL